jgi:hypothetical protein
VIPSFLQQKWSPLKMTIKIKMMAVALTMLFASILFAGIQYAAPHKPFNMCRMVQNEMLDTCGNDGVLNAQ